MKLIFPVVLLSASVALAQKPVPPVTIDGWKVEQVLVPPAIETPSVVCALPDGRVLVAEDPLDNRGGKEPIDRILCLYPDGNVTVWADKLFAVFGLAYIDGKVFVHAYPKLVVYTDDPASGTGKDPVVMIDQTNKPSNGGLNDHIAAQIRLAMDGYLYMSVGDKGIYGARSNYDRRTATLFGGGLLRIRPDGTQMEVYATGTRNHLDVSIDPEDEKFTYDNTDDGKGWWTRFTHMVDGGFYGYPWDYRPDMTGNKATDSLPKDWNKDVPYRPYTLWRMAEYGGGSPCGAIAYNEDALPPEYRGNLFHCEWGKGKVQRFVVQREGGTFRVAQMQDFLVKGQSADLRPLGICVTAEGDGFWVTDWGYGGWMNNKPDVGRLLKVTWTGKNHATPKPAWYVPAAMGQEFDATTTQLIDGLKHPAQSVRLVASRRLAERKAEAVAPLAALVGDASAPAHARWHAIWTLDRIDSSRSAGRAAILKVAGAKADASVRRQAIRQLGESRAREATDALTAALGDADGSIRFGAATALGRICDASAVPAILAKLDEKDLFVRFALFTALHRIGMIQPEAWAAIAQGLEGKSESVRMNTAFAFRDAYRPEAVTALVAIATDAKKPAEARAAALLAAAELHRKTKPWSGQWWGTGPAASPRPAKVEDWEGTTPVLNAIRDLATDPSPAVADAALQSMAIAPDPAAADLLVSLYPKQTTAASRQLVLQALAATSKSPKAAELAIGVLADPKVDPAVVPDAVAVVAASADAKDAAAPLANLLATSSNPEVLIATLDAVARLKAEPAASAAGKQIAHADPRVWNAAINALQPMTKSKDAVQTLIAALGDARQDVRKAAATALGNMKAADAVPALVEAAKKKSIGGEVAVALTRIPDVRALDIYIGSLSDRNRNNVRQVRDAIEKIREDARPIIEQRAEAGTLPPEAIAVLQEIYGQFEAVMEWQAIGPFPSDKPHPFDPAKLTGPIAVPGADGKPMPWRKLKSGGDGMLDLAKLIGSGDGQGMYLLATITSKTDRDADMRFGSDDTMIVWLNGTKLVEDTGSSGWDPKEASARVKLKVGTNVLVVRCGNNSGPWQFSASVGTEPHGKLFAKRVDPTTAPPAREAYAAFAMKTKGDPARGAKVFASDAASCIKCHQVTGPEGGIVGPSLLGVGAKYDRAKLIESVLYPSKQIFDGYQQTIVQTKDGDVVSGVIRSESDAELVMFDSGAQKITVAKANIAKRKATELSVMPEGLEGAMSQQEFADLIAYLEAQKEQPAGK